MDLQDFRRRAGPSCGIFRQWATPDLELAHMKPIPLIVASAAVGFVDSLAETGAPIERLLARGGLPQRARLGPDRLIPLQLLNRFVEESAAAQGLADLGLRVARRFGFKSVGRFGDAIRRAPTLYRAIETASALGSTFNSGASYWLVQEGESARICRRFRSQDVRFRQVDLLSVALMIDLVRRVGGPEWRPTSVALQSLGPHRLRDCEIFGDARVEVGRSATGITFPRSLLSRSLAQSGPSWRPATTGDRGADACPPTAFLPSVEVVIGTLLESGRADVGTAAKVAGSSVRSFQRRLTGCGVSYSDLVDKVRFRTASQLVRDPGVKMIEIALDLGYSDPAHFTRAFRRWTSLTPMEYRRLHVSGPEAMRRSA